MFKKLTNLLKRTKTPSILKTNSEARSKKNKPSLSALLCKETDEEDIKETENEDLTNLKRLYGDDYSPEEEGEPEKEEITKEEIESIQKEDDRFSWGSVSCDKIEPDDSKFADKFLEGANAMKIILKEVSDSVEAIGKEYEKTSGKFGKNESEWISNERLRNSEKLQKVKEYLQNLKAENSKMIRKFQYSGSNYTSPEYRMRKNEYNSLLSQFSNVLRSLQEVEYDNKASKRQEVVRNLTIFCGEKVDEKDVDKFMSNPQSIYGEKMSLQSRLTLSTEYQLAVEVRKELLELNTNMNMLMDMLLDVYALVNEQQQRVLNTIEGNVSLANNYVDSGSLRMNSELERRRKSEKKKSLFAKVVTFSLKQMFKK